MGCGSAVEDVVEVGSDIAAAATGNAEFIPLINAGESTVGGVAQGESLGKAAGQGAIAGGEALAGQELAGAVGIGQGNSAFNSALGITGDNPAGTGLPDLGSAFGGGTTPTGAAIDSTTGLPVSQETTNAAGATVNSATGGTVAAPSTPTASGAPSSGGGFTSAAAAPDLGANQVNTLFDDSVSSGTQTGASPNLGSVSAPPISSATAINQSPTDSLGSVTNPQPVQGPAPVANVAPATGGSSGLLGQAESLGLKAALPLGALAYDAIKGPSALPTQDSALVSGGSVTGPLQQLETQGATEATTGQLTPAQQATITQYTQQQQNQLIQQLASAGVTNPTQDSRYIQGMAQIQQQALALQQQYITAAINEATSAGGAAAGNISAVANQQVQEDTDFQNSLAAAVGALGSSLSGTNLNGIVNNRPQA